MLQRAVGEAERRPEAFGADGPWPAGWGAGAPNLSADDCGALGMWAGAHLALFVLAWAAAWVYRTTPGHAMLTGVFEHWDAVHFMIAQYGYFSPHSIVNDVAFFPGYPMTLAAVHLILRSWVLSELVVSAVAGNFVVVSLTRLAGGGAPVLYLLTAPRPQST